MSYEEPSRELQRNREYSLRLELRAQIKRDIGAGFEAGLHIFDAADAAGMSADIVIANMATDDDFRNWYTLSRGRTRMTTFEAPDALTPVEMKEALVRAAIRAGAIEKAAIVIALADPTTTEGKKDLKDFGLALMKDHLPKEVKKTVEKVDIPLSSKDVLVQMSESKEEIERLTQQVLDAEAAYDQEDDGPEGPGTAGDSVGPEEEAR